MSRCDGFEDIYGVCLYISVMASKETFLLLSGSVVVDDLLSSSAFRSLSCFLFHFRYYLPPNTMTLLSGTVQASVIDLCTAQSSFRHA